MLSKMTARSTIRSLTTGNLLNGSMVTTSFLNELKNVEQANRGIPSILIAHAPHFLTMHPHSHEIMSVTFPVISVRGVRAFNVFKAAATETFCSPSYANSCQYGLASLSACRLIRTTLINSVHRLSDTGSNVMLIVEPSYRATVVLLKSVSFLSG